MAYDTFRQKGRQSSRGSEITVHCGISRIVLNKGATALVNGDERVTFLIDIPAGKFAMVFDGGEYSYRIFKTKSSKQAVVGCLVFLRDSGLAGVGTLPATWDAEHRRIEWCAPEASGL